MLKFYQIKVEHRTIGTFFRKIIATKTVKSWKYRVAKQSIIYLYTKCQKWEAKQRFFRNNKRKAWI